MDKVHKHSSFNPKVMTSSKIKEKATKLRRVCILASPFCVMIFKEYANFVKAFYIEYKIKYSCCAKSEFTF